MELDEVTKKRIEKVLKKYCQEKVPLAWKCKIKLKYSICGNSVTLVEERLLFRSEIKRVKNLIAQFRYDYESGKWTLYWRKGNEQWDIYTEVDPSLNLFDLIEEMDKDPLGIFWSESL